MRSASSPITGSTFNTIAAVSRSTVAEPQVDGRSRTVVLSEVAALAANVLAGAVTGTRRTAVF
jgi:hypothetical protein